MFHSIVPHDSGTNPISECVTLPPFHSLPLSLLIHTTPSVHFFLENLIHSPALVPSPSHTSITVSFFHVALIVLPPALSPPLPSSNSCALALPTHHSQVYCHPLTGTPTSCCRSLYLSRPANPQPPSPTAAPVGPYTFYSFPPTFVIC
jgi:hypothetical protein